MKIFFINRYYLFFKEINFSLWFRNGILLTITRSTLSPPSDQPHHHQINLVSTIRSTSPSPDHHCLHYEINLTITRSPLSPPSDQPHLHQINLVSTISSTSPSPDQPCFHHQINLTITRSTLSPPSDQPHHH